MSIQDDIFDVIHALKDTEFAESFDRVYTYLGKMEQQIMDDAPKVKIVDGLYDVILQINDKAKENE